MRRVLLVLPLAVTLLAAASAAPASAAGPGLGFVECLTGKLPVTIEPRSPREGGCRVSQTVALDGEGTGMNHLTGLVASPDGRSLYAVSRSDDAVAVFATKPLRLRECFTTNKELRERGRRPCRLLPHPGSEDVVSGFNDVFFVAVSPDGRSVYTVSGDDSIATFARAPSGKLSYRGCITGDRSSYGSTKNGSCQAIPTATDTPGGFLSGLAGPSSLAVSPDSRFVYVALGEESAIATLERVPGGTLRFLGCVRGRDSRATSGTGAVSPCPLVAPETTPNPNGFGVVSPKRIVISADGSSLYASSPRRSAIAEFRRDPATGALAYQGCLGAANRGTGPGDPCRYIPGAGEIGDDTGMFGIAEILLDRGGDTLYGLSEIDEAVTAFGRDPVTGALTFASRTEATEPRGLALSGSGRSLLVASPPLAAIDRFAVAGGKLRYAGCLTGSRKATGPCTRARARTGRVQRLGFEAFSSLALAGGDLYASARGGSAVSRFRVR